MLLNANGILAVGAVYVNLVQIALFLDIDTQTTRQLAKHPIMRILFLYAFAYSISPNKMACALSVALFFVFEVKNFVQDIVEDASEIRDTTSNLVQKTVNKVEEKSDDVKKKVNQSGVVEL